MSYKKVYVCPDDDYELDHITGDQFKCLLCGNIVTVPNYREPSPEDRRCLVCGQDVDNTTEKRIYEDSAYGNVKHSYFHDECIAAYKQQITNDKKQLDMEIAIHKAVEQVECPNCHQIGTIILEPCGTKDNDGFEQALWMCDNNGCEVILTEDYIDAELLKMGITPLKCIRCGQAFSVCSGHECAVKRINLIK